jgi:hypothetical protein
MIDADGGTPGYPMNRSSSGVMLNAARADARAFRNTLRPGGHGRCPKTC